MEMNKGAVDLDYVSIRDLHSDNGQIIWQFGHKVYIMVLQILVLHFCSNMHIILIPSQDVLCSLR